MIHYCLCLGFLLLSLAVCAQEDDTIQFNQGLPKAGSDSSLYDDVKLDNPPPHLRRIEASEIPAKLKDELESNRLFSGWQKQNVWLDENTGLYWIDFAGGPAVRSYGLTAEGHTVSVKERTPPEETNESP
jgi:hypothetical protein